MESDEQVRAKLSSALPGAKLHFASPKPGELLKDAEALAPDLILLDLTLPGLKGAELVAGLHMHATLKHTPLVMVSRRGRQRAAIAGVEDVPDLSDTDEIHRRIEAALARSRVEKSVREAMRSVTPFFTGAIGGTEATLPPEEAEVLGELGVELDAALDPSPIAGHAARYHDMISSGMSVNEAAAFLSVTDGRIRQLLLADPPELYGVKVGSRWSIPRFQFANQGRVPHWSRVLAALDDDLNPVAVQNWFTGKSVDLEFEGERVSPRDWLLLGQDPRPVEELARNL